MENERFPHTLSIKRVSKDSNGMPIVDSNGDPTYVTVTLAKGVLNSNGEYKKNADGSFVTTNVTTLEFGYRNQGKDTNRGDAVEAEYKLATPVFVTPLLDGDIITLTDYDRSFNVSLVKKQTWNFGSNLWVNEVKN